MIYTRDRAPNVSLAWHLLAAALCLVFVIVQASSIDYGTTINNLPHIARYEVDPATVPSAALERRNLISRPSGIAETQQKWMMRFKLYSVEPDEVVSVMALARIKPAALQFDPGFYTYGGAYLYTLGAWYLTLSQVGLVRPGPLAEMLTEPDRMDVVYAFGRLFVLLAVMASAFVLWRTLSLVTTPGNALMATTIYLVCPATIAFSLLMKPHWYALLWANIAVLMVVRLFVLRQWRPWSAIATGIAMGLAVGSASTYGMFSILLGLAILFAVVRGYGRGRDLLIVPAAAIAAFLATNPYLVLNYGESANERAWAWANWFTVELTPRHLGLFVYNSLIPALGIAMTVCVVVVAVFRLVRPTHAGERALAAAILLVIVSGSAFTSAQVDWHTNIRYAPYLLTVGLLFLAATRLPGKPVLFGVMLVLTAIQALPMMLAFRDVDDPAHSTRLQAARWIEANIPTGTAVRLGTQTPSPYDVPPFDFARYSINAPDWRYLIVVHGEQPKADPARHALVRRFRPRLSSAWFALVIGYANPPVSIYRTTP